MAVKVTEDPSKGSTTTPNVHDENSEVARRELQVSFPPKASIRCIYSARSASDLAKARTGLVFTHGAGGTLQAEAIVNFADGFVSAATRPTLLCFQGNMNLASRVKMFTAVIESHKDQHPEEITTSPACLGGRSMGARAAIMAAAEETSHLVLVSYPLHTNKAVRDQILLDLPASIKVIFISGDHDAMCDLKKLETVRAKMKCQTWRIVVRGADHGMNMKPKSATRDIGKMTGALVATWLDGSDNKLTSGTIPWDPEGSAPQWSGWHEAEKPPDNSPDVSKDAQILEQNAEPTMSSSPKAKKNPRRHSVPESLEVPVKRRRKR